MRRGVPLLALGMVFAALAVATQPQWRNNRARRAAGACAELLEEPVTTEREGARDSLASYVLSGPSVVPPTHEKSAVANEDPRKAGTVLKLHGVRFAAPGDPNADLDLHLVARSALVRGLVDHARRQGQEIAVDSEFKPVAGGADFLATLEGDRLSLQYSAPGAESVSVSREPWKDRLSWPLRILIAASLACLALGASRWVRARKTST